MRRSNSGARKAKPADKPAAGSNLESLFTKYATLTGTDMGTGPTDYIATSGFMQLFTDMGISLDSPDVLVVCYHLQCEKPFTIQKKEFVDGLKALGVTKDVKEISAKLSDLRKRANVKDLFAFCFPFFRESERATVLCNDTAVAAWQTLVPTFYPNFPLKRLTDFTSQKHKKPVTKDIWIMTHKLIAQYPAGNFQDFVDDGAWPTFVDDFLDSLKN
eukprot:PhM_4_TR13594/c2_g2_i1/m.63690/K17822/DCUN1D1_2; DCN1-like protein 1/2